MTDVATRSGLRWAGKLGGWVTTSLLLGGLCVTAAGCPTSIVREPEPHPIDVLEAWHEALSEGRVEAAYSLLGGALRERYTLEAFRNVYNRQRDAMILQARDVLRRVQDVRAQESAEVQVGGTVVVLIREEPGWRLTVPAGAVKDAQK